LFNSYFPLIKRAVLYPAIVGSILNFFFKESPYYAEGTNFFVVQIFKDMLYFVELPDQFYYFITFYFLGYSYGILSSFLSARKLKTGIVGSLFILGLKLGIMLWTFFIAPIFLLIDIIVTVFNATNKNAKRKQKPIPSSEYSQ